MNESYTPFASENEELLSEDGKQSRVMKFEAPDGSFHVRKQMYRTELASTATETAKNKKIIFDVLQEYLGDYLVDTQYVVANDDDGEPTVHIEQPFLLGRTWAAVEEEGYITPSMREQRKDIKERIDKARDDTRLEDIREAYRISEAYTQRDNMIITPDGKIKVIDW